MRPVGGAKWVVQYNVSNTSLKEGRIRADPAAETAIGAGALIERVVPDARTKRMQCYQCGAVVRPGSKLCSNCGARLDAEPRERQRSWDDDPGRGGQGASREPNSRRNKPDPLDDPRAPRFLKVSDPPSRRSGGGSRDAWRATPDDPGRGRAPGRRADPLQSDYDGSADYASEYSAEYPQSRGNNQRKVIYDSRRPRSGTRDAGRGPRSDEGPSGYGGRSGRGPLDRHNDRPGRRSATYAEPEPQESWELPVPAGRGRARRLLPASQEYPARRRPAPVRGRAAAPTHASGEPRAESGPVRAIVVVAVFIALVAAAVGIARDKSLDTSLLSHLTGGTNATDNAPPFIAYTPGPSPTALPEYKEFDSTRSQYVLDYPESWSVSSSATPTKGTYDYLDEFTRSSPEASVILEESGAFSSITRSEIIQAEVRGATTGDRKFTLMADPITTVDIAGEQWVRSDYLVTEKDGTAFHMAILACHHDQRGYAIVLLSLPDNFSQDSQTAFEPMLDSLHFTG